MHGQPEIVELAWLTVEQAISGTEGSSQNNKPPKIAKIYKSQIGILRQAQAFLESKAKIAIAAKQAAETKDQQ